MSDVFIFVSRLAYTCIPRLIEALKHNSPNGANSSVVSITAVIESIGLTRMK